jgi:hypothetical protein
MQMINLMVKPWTAMLKHDFLKIGFLDRKQYLSLDIKHK